LRFEPQILSIAVELVDLPPQGLDLLDEIGVRRRRPPRRRPWIGTVG